MDEIMMKLPYNSLFVVERTLALKTKVKLDTGLAIGLGTSKNPHLRTFSIYQRGFKPLTGLGFIKTPASCRSMQAHIQ